MRNIGHVLMWGGFLAAAFMSMRESDQVSWTPYLITAFVGVVGVVLLRRTASAAASETSVVQANLKTLDSSLASAVGRLAALIQAKESVGVYDVHHRIDDELAEPLAEFADARESMIHGLGLAQYAEVMDHFARGERFVNRAWSASADGYIDEVWKSLDTAQSELSRAEASLRSHLGPAAG